MPKSCVVYGCNNNAANCKGRIPAIYFYEFSKNPLKQKRMDTWINFVRRKLPNGKPWEPSRWSCICSEHFINCKKSEDPSHPSYNPTLNPKTQISAISLSTTESKVKRHERLARRSNGIMKSETLESPENLPTNSIPTFEAPLFNEMSIQTDDVVQLGFWKLDDFSCNFLSPVEKSLQIIQHFEPFETPQTKTFKDKSSGNDEVSTVFCGYDSTKNNDKLIHDLTSCSQETFSRLLLLVPNNCNVVHSKLTVENRLLLALMKLKSDLSYVFLSSLFGVTVATASKVFTTTIMYIESASKNWIIWPSKSAIQLNMPPEFKKNYPNCRVTIDCTEVKTDKPPGVDKQMKMFSQYKGTWTVKFLVGITPCGYISFISKAFGGRSSDPYITNNCGILEKLEYGDLVLADKGFPNLQIKHGSIVVLPPFGSKNQIQFTEQQMSETYKVASVRIHVERAIQRIKVYKILTNRLSIDLLPYIDSIFHVCVVLANFQKPIIKQTKIQYSANC